MKNEAAADYSNRLQAIKAPDSIAMKAAKIVARAMEIGAYRPEAGTQDSLHNAMHRIVEGLQAYDQSVNIAASSSNISNEAAKSAKREIESQINTAAQGASVPNSVKKKIAQTLSNSKNAATQGALNIAMKTLQPAAKEAWETIKVSVGMSEENIPVNKIIAAFKDDGRHNEASRLVEDVAALRAACRANQR